MRFVSLGLLALLGLSVGVANAAPVVAPVVAGLFATSPVAELLPEKDGLKVSISASREGEFGAGSIRLRGSDPHINVVLQNTSSKPIRVFEEGNSWGYSSLTLEITKVDDKVLDKPLIVSREQMVWLANPRSSEVIAPDEVLVREISLRSSDTPFNQGGYKNFPLSLKGGSSRVTMRVVFTSKDSQSDQGETWTGRIASPLKDYTVFWRAN